MLNGDTKNSKKATFGGGCFWCTEAIFQRVEGVSKVVSGYAGGKISNPTYREVCSGLTGHAEVIQVTFDPEKVSFEELLRIFFSTHNPTTPNQQGNDIGSQYRSIILFHNEHQKEISEKVISDLENEDVYDQPIVTEIEEYKNFYPAEEEHQNYYNDNPSQPYCSFMITPKIKKFKETFNEKLKG